MKKTTIFGIMALMIVGMIATVSAYRGDYSIKGPNYSEDRHIAMEAAFENLDYDAWKTLMDERNGRVTEVITEDNFARFADMHEAMEDGDFETAQNIRTELGLGIGPKDGSGFRGMRGSGQGVGQKDGFLGQGCGMR